MMPYCKIRWCICTCTYLGIANWPLAQCWQWAEDTAGMEGGMGGVLESPPKWPGHV